MTLSKRREMSQRDIDMTAATSKTNPCDVLKAGLGVLRGGSWAEERERLE